MCRLQHNKSSTKLDSPGRDKKQGSFGVEILCTFAAAVICMLVHFHVHREHRTHTLPHHTSRPPASLTRTHMHTVTLSRHTWTHAILHPGTMGLTEASSTPTRAFHKTPTTTSRDSTQCRGISSHSPNGGRCLVNSWDGHLPGCTASAEVTVPSYIPLEPSARKLNLRLSAMGAPCCRDAAANGSSSQKCACSFAVAMTSNPGCAYTHA